MRSCEVCGRKLPKNKMCCITSADKKERYYFCTYCYLDEMDIIHALKHKKDLKKNEKNIYKTKKRFVYDKNARDKPNTYK